MMVEVRGGKRIAVDGGARAATLLFVAVAVAIVAASCMSEDGTTGGERGVSRREPAPWRRGR